VRWPRRFREPGYATVGGGEEHAELLRLRERFLKSLQLLRDELGEKRRQAGGVSARAREARDVSDAHRIAVGAEHDRDGPRGGEQDSRLRRGGGYDDVETRSDQLSGKSRQLVGPFPPTELEGQVLALDVAQLP
jgi:hypothetical protein